MNQPKSGEEIWIVSLLVAV